MNEPELIVYVDEDGVPTGETAPKLAAHTTSTKRHLAFSCYIFDDDGKLLVTQRALSKKVWPGVWTNSVCGHPGPGETLEHALRRRLDYELGMGVTDITLVLPAYKYTTPPYEGIIENEFCPVYVAQMATPPNPNPEEVEAYQWMSWDQFVRVTSGDTKDVYSWWCKDQVKRLISEPIIQRYAKI